MTLGQSGQGAALGGCCLAPKDFEGFSSHSPSSAPLLRAENSLIHALLPVPGRTAFDTVTSSPVIM